MVRLFNVFHPSRTFALVCLEIALILLCFVTSLFLNGGTDSFTVLNDPTAILQFLVMTGACVFCLYYFDLYNFQKINNGRELFRRLLLVIGTASLILGLVYYVFPDLIVARGIYLIASLMLLVVLSGLRITFGRLNQLPIGSERVILIGLSSLGCDLTREIRLRPELGINLVGYLDDGELGMQPSVPIPRLGSTHEMEEIVSQSRADAVIVALSDRRGRLPVNLLLKLCFGGVRIQEARTVFERITGKIPLEDLRPSWLIFSDGFRTRRGMMAIQRVCGLVASLIGLVIALPIMGLVSIAIKLDSEGPVLFRQVRTGKNGRVFKLYKFRSMRSDAESNSGAVWSIDNDPRVTRIGHALRKFRLDELPQLWNVVRGDMNLVGPRPERPEFVQILEERIPYYNFRHFVHPGITGWAQVRYSYGSTIEEQHEKLRYDLFYIKNVSLSLDFYIMFQTIKIVLRGRGAR